MKFLHALTMSFLLLNFDQKARNAKISPIFHFDPGHQSWICHILCVNDLKLTLGCSLTGTRALTVSRIGFSWYMSTNLLSRPGGFPPDCIRAISEKEQEKKRNYYLVTFIYLCIYSFEIFFWGGCKNLSKLVCILHLET